MVFVGATWTWCHLAISPIPFLRTRTITLVITHAHMKSHMQKQKPVLRLEVAANAVCRRPRRCGSMPPTLSASCDGKCELRITRANYRPRTLAPEGGGPYFRLRLDCGWSTATTALASSFPAHFQRTEYGLLAVILRLFCDWLRLFCGWIRLVYGYFTAGVRLFQTQGQGTGTFNHKKYQSNPPRADRAPT